MIIDLINGLLSQLSGINNFWFHRADGSADFPDVFIVYDIYDYPAQRGDGTETATNYTVTFNVYAKTPAAVNDVYISLLGVMADNDFIRAGCTYTSTDSFPGYFQRSVDFNYIEFIE